MEAMWLPVVLIAAGAVFLVVGTVRWLFDRYRGNPPYQNRRRAN